MDGFEIMRKNAFNLTLATAVTGIFGFFLRWLQNLNGFDDNGLAIPGASIAAVFFVYSLAVLALFILEERFYLRKLNRSSLAAEALRTPNFIVRALLMVAAGLMVIGCLIMMFSSDFSSYPGMQRITGALGIFAGLCLPFLSKPKAQNEDGSSGTVACLIPVLFGCMWLVTAYRIESENPILWTYAPAMLAIIALLVSFYYLAAYFYKRAKPARCLLALQISSYLCICTLMDEHSAADTLIFIACIIAALSFQYIIIYNGEREPKAEEKAEN